MQFRIVESSDFHQTPHIYVFWRADSEYINENCRLADFYGETIINHKNHGCLRLSQPLCKISQNVPNITCRPHRDTHFLLNAFFSTIDSFRENKWLRKSPHRVPVCLIPFNLNFSKNNCFVAKMCRTSKIDLFIRYNFCRKFSFPRSIFIKFKWKKLVKNIFFFTFYLKNEICRYFHYHIRNQRLKIRGYGEFQINRC